MSQPNLSNPERAFTSDGYQRSHKNSWDSEKSWDIDDNHQFKSWLTHKARLVTGQMQEFAKKKVFTRGGYRKIPVIKQKDLKPQNMKDKPQVQAVFIIKQGHTEPMAIRKEGTTKQYNVNDKVDVYSTRLRTVKLTNIVSGGWCWVYTGDTTDTARKVSCKKIRNKETQVTCDRKIDCLPEMAEIRDEFKDKGCVYLRIVPFIGKPRMEKSEFKVEMVGEGMWEPGWVKKDTGGATVRKVKLDGGPTLENVKRADVLPMGPAKMVDFDEAKDPDSFSACQKQKQGKSLSSSSRSSASSSSFSDSERVKRLFTSITTASTVLLVKSLVQSKGTFRASLARINLAKERLDGWWPKNTLLRGLKSAGNTMLSLVAGGLEMAVLALDRGLLHLARNHPKGRPLCPKADLDVQGTIYKGVTDIECFEKVLQPLTEKVHTTMDEMKKQKKKFRNGNPDRTRAVTICIGSSGAAHATAGLGQHFSASAGLFVTINFDSLSLEVGFSYGVSREAGVGPPSAGIGAAVWLEVLYGTMYERSKYSLALGAGVEGAMVGLPVGVGGSVSVIFRKTKEEMCAEYEKEQQGQQSTMQQVKAQAIEQAKGVGTLGILDWVQFGKHMGKYCKIDYGHNPTAWQKFVSAALPSSRCILGFNVAMQVSLGVGLPITVDMGLQMSVYGNYFSIGGTGVPGQGFFHNGKDVAAAVKTLKCAPEDEEQSRGAQGKEGTSYSRFKQIFPSDQLLKNQDKVDVAHHLRMMRHRK